ncbi:MAG: hypothetical protein HXY24_10675, partial [Rubrivivax sp.]|nr:hypothetical protein [Rubrivivax sp.]
YRTPDGDAALLRRSLTDLPRSAPPSPKSNTFTQVTRLGAFKVLAEEYRIDLETVTDDGQKIITLDGFTYDPIARRYDLTIQSLMDQPVDDKLTVQAFGPNDVLIYEETAPVVLRPDRPTKYSIAVPTDRGEVYGLRVIVHDPAIVQTIIRRLKSSITGLSAWLKESLSETGNAAGFSFSATLKFEVKVLEIMLVAYSLQCASTGTCVYKQEGLVYQPGAQWFDVITLGVRDYLRNTFGARSIEDALKSLLLEGIPLGTATAALPVGLRVTGGFDTQCLPPHLLNQAKELSADMVRLGKEVAAGLNFAFKQQFETFQGDGVTLPIPPTTFLALKIGPVFAFNVEIDSNGDYGLYVELQWQMGVSAALLLQGFPLAGLLDKVLKAAKLVNSIHGAVEFIRGIYVLLEMVGTFAAADSAFNDADVDKCKKKHTASPRSNPPPPPNGHPDERFDAIEAAFLTEPTGDSGRLAVLNGYVTRAQRLGLPRAEAYWTLRLRQAELVQFDNDTAARLAEQQEIETRTTTALDRIQGLISGTIPITPSATITDAVLSEYDAFVTGLGSTAREQARQVLIDALDFAQAQYAQLRGQELDLQRELRLLLQGTGVGVIDDGLITWALGAIGSVGVDAVPVQIVPGSTLSGLPESRYYTPFEAPPVVIAPSGSLHRFVGSDEARAWLETYAASGGTLIVLAQAHSADWELLPGGQLRGLGYEQDILCKDASVRIVNPSEWLTGLSRDLPNIQLDGSFTTLPDGARVILQRTTGNQLPAMIEYPFGAGRVVAMSLYPDFYVNGMQSAEDLIFARSLFGLAYLTATGEPIAARVNANQPIALPLSITNTAATTATVARVPGDYFGANAAESWRWAAHRIAGLQHEATVNLNPPLPGGQSRTIQANFTAPNYAGLYRSAYRFDAQPYVTPGPFYEVLSPTVGILSRPLISLFARNQIDYRYGETAIVTLTLKNEMTTTRNLRLDTLNGSVTVSIGPSATITQPVFTGPVFENRVITATLVENGARLASTLTTLSLRPPTFGLDVTPRAINVGLPVTLIVTATARQVPPATPLTFELRRSNTLIDQVNTALNGTLDLTQATAQFSTSAAAANEDFTVRAVISGQPVMTQTIAAVTPGRIETVALNGDLTLNTLQPQAAAMTLNSARSGAVITAQAVLRNDLGVISTGPQAGAIVTDQLQTIGLDVAVPAALDPTRSYTLIYSLTTQLIGSPVTFTQAAALPLSLSGPQLTLDSAVLFPQEPFYFSLTPAPGSRLIAPVGPYTVTLTHAPSAFLFTTVLTGTPSANGLSFNFIAPGLPAPGLYQLTVTSPQLFNWSETKAALVRERALTFESPSSVNAGGTLIASVTSSADLDNPISGTLSLYDFDGQRLSVTAFSGLLAGASRTLNVALPIPADIRRGAYSLRWQGVNDLGAPFASSDVVNVNGLNTRLAAQTDRAWYQPGENVTASMTITSNPALSTAWLRWQIAAAPQPYDLSTITLAGNDWLAEGVGQNARAAFWDMDISPDGAFALIVDRYSRVILRLDLTTNEVRWVAGRPALSGIGGILDGVGRDAVFNSPRHIQISADGARAYVLDYGSFRLRRIDLSNYAVTTLAGPGTSYSWRPSGMVISADETFVLFTHIDGFSTGVYRYDLAAQTMTWLGNPDPYFSHSFTDITLNVTGTLAYLPDVISGNVYQLNLATHAYSIVPDGLSGPLATGDAQLTLSADGQQLYFTDPGGYTVQQLNIVSGTTTTLAGLKNTSGDVDGVGAAARFSTLHDIAVTPDGSLALISLKHGGLARLNLATHTVTTIAGVRAGTRDGTGTQARLIKAGGLDVDPTGSFALVVDFA